MKNILYFENAKKKRTEIAKNVDSISQAINEIKAFCYQKNPNFNIYYIRLWHSEENELTFDVGSWTEFFYLVGEVPKREQETQEVNTSTADAERKRLYYRPE